MKISVLEMQNGYSDYNKNLLPVVERRIHMELRTRILPRMLNSEVEAYLKENDIIIVPVGTVEMQAECR